MALPAGRRSSRMRCGPGGQGQREVFLPLSHPPGEAQVDFGFAQVKLAGEATKVALFVMTLPYSDALLSRCFRGSAPKPFWKGTSGPSRSSAACRDGSATTTARSRWRRSPGADEREVTKEFLRLKSHYPVPGPLLPGPPAQREGARGTAVGLCPDELPGAGPGSGQPWSQLNAELLQRCQADLDRQLCGKPAPKASAAGRRATGYAADRRPRSSRPGE